MRTSLFHSPERLIVGDAPLVGVLDLPGTVQRPPIRLFFPADTAVSGASAVPLKPASYFVDNRVAYVLQGFAHIALARHTTKLHRWILRPLFWFVSLFFPARFLKIPGTVHVKSRKDKRCAVKYVPPKSLTLVENNNTAKEEDPLPKKNTQSVVVFSHGLTGTGEENSIFCTSLAKRGHVVASIHHRDGSSSRVPMPDGTCKFYEHLPTGDAYDPKDRLEQLNTRAREFLHCCNWMLGDAIIEEGDQYQDHSILKQIQPYLDKDKIVASGFSYGAATASLAATMEPAKFQCAILLDGWFHIDYSSRGIEFDLPPEAFGSSWHDASTTQVGNDKSTDTNSKSKRGLSIQSLFINSSQFAGYEKLYGATKRLAQRVEANIISDNKYRKDTTTTTTTHQEMVGAEMHVIPGTSHQNFCDTIFWLPRRLAKRVFFLGDTDAYEAYESILNKTIQFLERF